MWEAVSGVLTLLANRVILVPHDSALRGTIILCNPTLHALNDDVVAGFTFFRDALVVLFFSVA